MRKHLLPCVLILVLMGLGGANAQGLLNNPEFDTMSEENHLLPAGWVACKNCGDMYQAVNYDGYQDAGSLYYRIAEEKPHGVMSQMITVEPNKDYVVTAAMKSDGTLQPVVRVYSVELQQVAVDLVCRGEEVWTLYTATFNSGNSRQMEVQLFGDRAMTRRDNPVAPAGFSAFDAVQVYPASDVPEVVRPKALFTPPGPNVALHKPYTMTPAPNYRLSADPDDIIHLTDGEYTVGYFWVQKSTVGWQNQNPITITVDLEQVEPIIGASLNSAAGVAGVSWPASIIVLVSDDGERWTFAGDLVSLGTKKTSPSPDYYSVFRYATDELQARGRYVRFVVDGSGFLFTDEVEVYRGPDELLAQAPEGRIVEDTEAFFMNQRIFNSMLLRMRTDLAAARDRLQSAAIGATEKAELLARADELSLAVEALSDEIPAGFKAVLPLNDVHAGIYALNAPVLRSRKLAPLTPWTKHRFDMLRPTEAPASMPRSVPSLRVDMLPNEHRAEVFNLTNSTDSPMVANITIAGLPGGINPDYINVHEVLFTDTVELAPIASALPEARQGRKGYTVRIPPGMTRQVWLGFNPTDIDAGEYQGTVNVRVGRGIGDIEMPLTMKLYPGRFPDEVTLSFGGWDYTMGRGTYGATPTNIPQLIAFLREYGVNTPWANPGTMPGNAQFDAAGNLTSTLDFTIWDEWVERWEGTRHYFVFMNVRETFHNERMGTERFNTMVGAYFKAWTAHMATQGLEPSQLAVLIFDEPNQHDQDEIIVAWGKAIKAATPEVRIFNDPIYHLPENALPAMLEISDIVCPNTGHWRNFSERSRQVYLDQQARGCELWFYYCSGPSNMLDPHTYFRAQNWWAIRHGALGSHYWAFADIGGGTSSWNPYGQRRTTFSPVFLDPFSVTTAKQMEAIREGVADYEYFVLLGALVDELEQRGVQHPLIAEAKQFMVDAPVEVTELNAGESTYWNADKDRSIMDTMRIRALQYMEALSAL